MLFSKFVVLGCFIVAFSSCSTLVKVPVREVTFDQAKTSWENVLGHYVDKDGWVDFEGLKKNPEDLNNYVAFVAANDPDKNTNLFKTSQDRLAFYINSYNALSMYNVLDSNIPYTNAGLRKVNFFMLKKIPIGQHVMSLKTYEDKTIRTLAEPRIHFVLNCMAMSCPFLPQKAFAGATLEQELEASTKFFFSEKRNYYLDHQNKTAYVTEILNFFPKDFLVKAPSVVDFINIYAAEKIPAGYQLKFIPYNWTIINQARKSELLGQ